jgi:hypothetical protein
MKCLGCGSDCRCKEPAKFATWPLEQSLSQEALRQLAHILDQWLIGNTGPAWGEIENASNIIRSYLQRTQIDELLL